MWAELVVLVGSVLFADESGRRVVATRDRGVTIVPDIPHHIEPEPDAEFYVQFYETDEPGNETGTANRDG